MLSVGGLFQAAASDLLVCVCVCMAIQLASACEGINNRLTPRGKSPRRSAPAGPVCFLSV